MKKQVEKFIPAALAAVRERLTSDIEKKKVFEEYDGYAASLGASIVTSGLLPTLSFYTDVHKIEKNAEKEAKKSRRYRILLVVADVLRKNGWIDISSEKNGLLEFVLTKKDERKIKSDLLAATIALKLALRNFEHIPSPKAE